MANNVIQSVGEGPVVASIDAIALYDPKDGRVVHMHHVVTFEGITAQDREAQRQNALDLARKFGHKVVDLQVLHVPNFQPTGKAYRVDLAKKALIAMPFPKRK